MKPTQPLTIGWRILHANARVMLVLLSPIALGLTLFVSAHLLLNSHHALGLIEGELDKIFAGTFNIEELRVGLDPRHIEVYGVTLLDPSREKVNRIEHLEADLKLSSLLQGMLHIEKVKIIGGDALVAFDDRGGFNYTDAFYTGPRREAPEEDGSALSIFIEDVDLQDVDLQLTFPDFDVRWESLSIDDFSLALDGPHMRMGARKMHTAKGVGTFKAEMFGAKPQPEGGPPIEGAKEPLVLPINDLSIEHWDWSGDGFTVGKMNFRSDGSVFDLTEGMMDFGDASGFRYRGKLEVSLPAFAKEVEYFTGPLIESPVSLSMGFSGFSGPEMNDGSFISTSLKTDLSPVKVRGMTFERGRLEFRLVNRRLYFEVFELAGYGGVISLTPEATGPLPEWLKAKSEPPAAPGRGYLNLTGLTYDLPLQIDGLKLHEVMEDAVPGIAPEAVIPATGRLSGEVRASGRLIDTRDAERLVSLPAFHRADFERVELHRPNRFLSRAAAGVPARVIGLSGTLLLLDDHLRSEGDLVLSLDRDVLEFSGLDFDLEAQRLSLGLRAEVAEVAPYAALYGVRDVSGRLSLSLRSSGPLMDPDLTAGRIVLSDPVLMGYSGREISVDFSMLEGWLGLEELRASGQFGEVSAQGRVKVYTQSLERPESDPTLDLAFDAPRIDLAAISEIAGLEVPLSGEAMVRRGTVKGRSSNPEVEAHISTGPVVIDDQSIHRFHAGVKIERGGVEVEDLTLVLDQRHGRVNGHFKWRFDGEIEAALRVTAFELGDIRALSNAEVSGFVEMLHMDLAGQLRLDALDGTGKRLQGGVREVSTKDVVGWITTQKMKLSGSLIGRRLKVGPERLGRVFGAWNTQREVFSMSLVAMPFVPASALASVYEFVGLNKDEKRKAVRDAYPPLLGLELVMPQTIDADSGGEINVKLNVHKLNLRGVLAGILEGRAAKEEAGVEAPRGEGEPRTVSKEAQEGSVDEVMEMLGELTLTGETELNFYRDDLSWVVDGRYSELKVSTLGQTLSNTDVRTRGACLEKIRAAGGDEGSVEAGESCAQDVELTFNGKVLNVKSLSLGGVDLTGSVSLLSDGRSDFDLKLKGVLDMRLLNFMPEVMTDLRGMAGVDLSFEGYLGEDELPDVKGMLSLSQKRRDWVRFKLRSLEDEVQFKSGMIVVCPSRKLDESDPLRSWCKGFEQGYIVIPKSHHLRVGLLDGDAKITGQIPLLEDGLGTISLSVAARNMSYRVPGAMDMTFSAEMDLELADLSKPETWTVGSKNSVVRVLEGRYYKDQNFLREMGVSRLEAALGGGKASRFEGESIMEHPIFSKVNLDTKIIISDGFVIRSEIETANVDLEMKAEIDVSQTLADLRLEGEVKILAGGKLDYKGRDFIIREGSVSWEGTEDFANPHLKLVAEASIPNSCATNTDALGESDVVTYQVTMNLDGRPQSDIGRYELTSRPFADEKDVFFLILAGCTSDQMDAASASSPGLAIALQPIFGRVEKELTQVLNVEDVSIFSDLEETRVRLSERITKRFIIRFAGAFGAEGAEQSFSGQYIILDNLRLEIGENSNDDEVKLDANIRLRIPLDD